MTLDHHAARLVLRRKLVELTGLPSIQGENENFMRPPVTSGALWLRETLLISSERHAALGFLETLGQYRLDVFGPIGHGTQATSDLAQTIAQHFRPTQTLCEVDDSFGLVVYKTERQPARADDGWYLLPVIISWRTHTSTGD